MNIPARYCTGYLRDIGVPPTSSRWILVRGSRRTWAGYGTLLTRVTMSRALAAFSRRRGRDATDAALTTTFGIHQLESFKV
jgi:hypothetical protein